MSKKGNTPKLYSNLENGSKKSKVPTKEFVDSLRRDYDPANNTEILGNLIRRGSTSGNVDEVFIERMKNWDQDKKYYDEHVGADKYVILDTGKFYTLDGEDLPTMNIDSISKEKRKYHKTEAQLLNEQNIELQRQQNKLFGRPETPDEEEVKMGKNGEVLVQKQNNDEILRDVLENLRELRSLVHENKAVSYDTNQKAIEIQETTTEHSAASFKFYETGEKAFKEIKKDVKNIVENTKNLPGVSRCSPTSVIGILYCIRGLIEILYSFLCILVFLYTKVIAAIRSGYYSIFIGPFILIAFVLDILIMMVTGFLAACLISHVGVMTGRPELLKHSMVMIIKTIIDGTAALVRIIPTGMPKDAPTIYNVGEAMGKEVATNPNTKEIVETFNSASEIVKSGINATINYVKDTGVSIKTIQTYSEQMMEWMVNQTNFFGKGSTYETVGSALSSSFSSLFSTDKGATISGAISGGRKERTRKRKTKRKTKKSSKIKKMKFTKRKNGLRKSKNGLRKSKRKGGNVIIIPKINPDSNIDFNKLFSQDDNPELQKVMKSLANIGHLIKDMTDLKGVDFDRKPSKLEEEMFEKFKSMFDIVIPSTFSLMDMIHNTVNETPKNFIKDQKTKKLK
jgi:hypothetical protein